MMSRGVKMHTKKGASRPARRLWPVTGRRKRRDHELKALGDGLWLGARIL